MLGPDGVGKAGTERVEAPWRAGRGTGPRGSALQARSMPQGTVSSPCQTPLPHAFLGFRGFDPHELGHLSSWLLRPECPPAQPARPLPRLWPPLPGVTTGERTTWAVAPPRPAPRPWLSAPRVLIPAAHSTDFGDLFSQRPGFLDSILGLILASVCLLNKYWMNGCL